MNNTTPINANIIIRTANGLVNKFIKLTLVLVTLVVVVVVVLDVVLDDVVVVVLDAPLELP